MFVLVVKWKISSNKRKVTTMREENRIGGPVGTAWPPPVPLVCGHEEEDSG